MNVAELAQRGAALEAKVGVRREEATAAGAERGVADDGPELRGHAGPLLSCRLR